MGSVALRFVNEESVESMSNNPFSSAKLKIERAKRHLLEVERACREMPMRQALELMTGVDSQTGKFKAIYMAHSDMPMQFAPIVGDAVHNLRSAFDYIAVGLTLPPIGTGDLKDSYFPTGKDRQAFIEARDGVPAGRGKRKNVGKMEGAPADALRMVEELEPYDGGKYSIRALHDLDIIDKHKLLIPALSRLRINRVDISFEGKTYSLGVTDFQPDNDGLTFAALFEIPGATLHQFKVERNFHPSFEIVFGKGQPLEGQGIMETLFKLTNVAKRFVEACEAHFL
jgi:hypothetical protein